MGALYLASIQKCVLYIELKLISSNKASVVSYGFNILQQGGENIHKFENHMNRPVALSINVHFKLHARELDKFNIYFLQS